jgi:hypothetical protein
MPNLAVSAVGMGDGDETYLRNIVGLQQLKNFWNAIKKKRDDPLLTMGKFGQGSHIGLIYQCYFQANIW